MDASVINDIEEELQRKDTVCSITAMMSSGKDINKNLTK